MTELLTRAEVASILHCSPLTVGRKQKQWGLEPIRAGRQVVYDSANLGLVILRLRRFRTKNKKGQSASPPLNARVSPLTLEDKIVGIPNLSS